ncbi:MAG: hypothetical protein OXN89_00970 [Bryobacterales bacterium]|nr:hypothetical protein [Bryobacterales bacterium]
MLNLPAFALHTALDILPGRWRQCRDYLDTRRAFFMMLDVFPQEVVSRDGPRLLDTLLHRRGPPNKQWFASPG